MKKTISDLESFISIEYRYGDSSVPPEFHRSFTINITKDKLHIIVDSYGDIISDKTFPLFPEDLKQIVSAVNKINIKRKYFTKPGCTGGVTKEFIIKTSQADYKTSVYYCGNLPPAKLTAEIDKAAELITSKIPNLEKVLNRS